MKRYDVYSIGHALVDMEVEVEDAFLSEAALEKGTMALVEAARQNELIQRLHGLEHKRSCGGSAANTTIAVAQFGGRSFFSCKVADDESGHFFAHDLTQTGVANNQALMKGDGATGHCLVLISDDAERTMCTHLGTSETVGPEQLDEEAIKQAEWVYVEGYLVTSPTARAAAVQAANLARRHGAKVALTFSDPNMVKYFRDGLDEIIGPGLDLLFCNESEALTYAGGNDIQQAMEALKGRSKAVCITQGSRGAAVWDGNRQIEVVGNVVDAVDTNGAGDLFAGTFLYGITNGLTYGRAGRLACYASSVLVTQFGARLAPEQAPAILERALK